MKECFAITTYCNTPKKIEALNRTIENVKQYGLPIFIHAHYPLSDAIQKKVHSYFYSSDNPITSRHNRFWYFVDNYKLEIKVYETTYTVLKAWSESVKILDDYDKIHVINYDTNLTPDVFQLSRKYPQSIFLQNQSTEKNYIVAIYFTLNKRSFEYFRESITFKKFMDYDWGGTFLPIIEEFVPAFTIGEDFFQVPNTEFSQDELTKYDIGSGFIWDRDLNLDVCKIFIGEIIGDTSGLTHILFFDIKKPMHIAISTPNSMIHKYVQKTELISTNHPFIGLREIQIAINGVSVPSELINTFLKLECKIFNE